MYILEQKSMSRLYRFFVHSRYSAQVRRNRLPECFTVAVWVESCHVHSSIPLIYNQVHIWRIFLFCALQWRHNERDGVWNHQALSKKTSKLRVTDLCLGNSPGTGEFPAQKASNAENVSIWWRHHGMLGRPVQLTILRYLRWWVVGWWQTGNKSPAICKVMKQVTDERDGVRQ